MDEFFLCFWGGLLYNRNSIKICKMKMDGKKLKEKKEKKTTPIGSCDTCANYAYDDEMEYYVCEMDLDEDEMVRFLSGNYSACPYYQNGDEYSVVRHQM